MWKSPLAWPTNRETLDLFLRHFAIPTTAPPRATLSRVIGAFARLPYENLTKIVLEVDVRGGMRSLRTPREVIEGYIRWGAGGTCFALTATLLHLIRALGFRAEPILADRRYGADTHCALLVWLEELPQLVDPGYLIVEPVPLVGRGVIELRTSFNEVALTPHDDGLKWDLSTRQHGSLVYRLTLKASPVDESQFLRAWEASFEWEMMKYPVLTRVVGEAQTYLQGRRLQTRTHDKVERSELTEDEWATRMAGEFGLSPELVRAALRAWERRGEQPGSPSSSS
ncbi:MAG: arylamine N-acetyltransferase [Pirellulales bacterium]